MGGELSKDTNTVDGTGVQGARKRGGLNDFIFIQVPATTPAGTPLVVTYDTTAIVKGVAPATLAVGQEIAITPRLAGATAEYMWCQLRGVCQALVDGTADVTSGHYLKVINAGVALIEDGASMSTSSIAVAQSTYTTNSAALKSVILMGAKGAIIATA